MFAAGDDVVAATKLCGEPQCPFRPLAACRCVPFVVVVRSRGILACETCCQSSLFEGYFMLDVEKATDAEEAAWKLAEFELRGRYGKIEPCLVLVAASCILTFVFLKSEGWLKTALVFWGLQHGGSSLFGRPRMNAAATLLQSLWRQSKDVRRPKQHFQVGSVYVHFMESRSGIVARMLV